MNRILLVLQLATLGLVAYVALSPPPGQAEAAAAAAGRGESLEAAGAFAAAALAYEQAAALDPTQAGPRFDAARRAEALGAIAAAELPGREVWARLDAVASALEAGGVAESVAVGRILRLVLARAAGLRAEALAQLAKLVEAGEKSPWFAWHAGSLRLEEARLAEARELLEGLVKAQPGFGAGWHRLAMTYVADGRHEAAIEALQRAVASGAGVGAEVDLGRLFLKREMWAEGLPHLENALRARLSAPEMAEVLRLVAAAHFHLKRFERAAETYQKAWDLVPDPRTLLSAAIALSAGERPAEAMRLLATLAPRAEEVPEVLYQQAAVARALGQDARPVLERYLALARGREGEAERVKQAEAALQAPAQDAPKPQ